LDKSSYEYNERIKLNILLTNNANEAAYSFPIRIFSTNDECVTGINIQQITPYQKTSLKEPFRSLSKSISYQPSDFCVEQIQPGRQRQIDLEIINKCSPGDAHFIIFVHAIGKLEEVKDRGIKTINVYNSSTGQIELKYKSLK